MGRKQRLGLAISPSCVENKVANAVHLSYPQIKSFKELIFSKSVNNAQSKI